MFSFRSCNETHLQTVYRLYSDNYLATITVRCGDRYHLSMWDNSSSQDYSELHKLLLKSMQTDVFLACFSVMSQTTLESIKQKVS